MRTAGVLHAGERKKSKRKKERNGLFTLRQNDTASTRTLRHTSSRPITLAFYTYSLRGKSKTRRMKSLTFSVNQVRGLTVKLSFSLKTPSRVPHSMARSKPTFEQARPASFVKFYILHRNHCLGNETFLNGGKDRIKIRASENYFGSKDIYVFFQYLARNSYSMTVMIYCSIGSVICACIPAQQGVLSYLIPLTSNKLHNFRRDLYAQICIIP